VCTIARSEVVFYNKREENIFRGKTRQQRVTKFKLLLRCGILWVVVRLGPTTRSMIYIKA
jgi:hypothetical protein